MRKARLISLCLLLVLSVAIIGYGVYAASTVNMSANGTIAFISNDVKADIECYVGSDSGTASKTVTFTKNDESNSWAPTLSFDTNTVRSNPANNATFTKQLSFKIRNKTSKPVYAYFTNTSGEITNDTLNTSSSKNINVTLSGKTTIEVSGVQTLTITFTIPSTNNKFTRDETANFAYRLVLSSFDPALV